MLLYFKTKICIQIERTNIKLISNTYLEPTFTHHSKKTNDQSEDGLRYETNGLFLGEVRILLYFCRAIQDCNFFARLIA